MAGIPRQAPVPLGTNSDTRKSSSIATFALKRFRRSGFLLSGQNSKFRKTATQSSETSREALAVDIRERRQPAADNAMLFPEKPLATALAIRVPSLARPTGLEPMFSP